MNMIARGFTFLIFLFLVNMQIMAEVEELEGLWGGLTQTDDVVYTDGDQWGFYFEDAVCYYAYCFDNEWFYSCEKPLGLVEKAYEPNTFRSSDSRVRFILKGEKLFVESKPQGSVHLITFGVKKITGIKPKEATIAQLQIKAKKYYTQN
ncbi:MAG: hypothetical protein K2I95_00465 [Treponemataceae bacterium]|nr:hypothetical protein [Treponemataceae bacterium]